jgi:hypothetical protein
MPASRFGMTQVEQERRYAMNTQVDEMVGYPTRHFARPDEVLNHPSLSSKDKRRILESWKLDAQRLADSTDENMTGGEESNLRDISRALVHLKITTTPLAIQPKRTAPVGSGMTIGGLLGAGVGLVAAAATATVSLALIAQTTMAGLVIGGVAGALKGAADKAEQ